MNYFENLLESNNHFIRDRSINNLNLFKMLIKIMMQWWSFFLFFLFLLFFSLLGLWFIFVPEDIVKFKNRAIVPGKRPLHQQFQRPILLIRNREGFAFDRWPLVWFLIDQVDDDEDSNICLHNCGIVNQNTLFMVCYLIKLVRIDFLLTKVWFKLK